MQNQIYELTSVTLFNIPNLNIVKSMKAFEYLLQIILHRTLIYIFYSLAYIFNFSMRNKIGLEN